MLIIAILFAICGIIANRKLSWENKIWFREIQIRKKNLGLFLEIICIWISLFILNDWIVELTKTNKELNKSNSSLTSKIDSHLKLNKDIIETFSENIPEEQKKEKAKYILEEFEENTWSDLNELKIWIDSIINNPEIFKEESKERKTELKILKSSLNNKYYPEFLNIFDTIKLIWTNIDEIEVTEKNTFPENIYWIDEKNYSLEIRFQENIYWRIYIDSDDPIRENSSALRIKLERWEKIEEYMTEELEFLIFTKLDTNESYIYTNALYNFRKIQEANNDTRTSDISWEIIKVLKKIIQEEILIQEEI